MRAKEKKAVEWLTAFAGRLRNWPERYGLMTCADIIETQHKEILRLRRSRRGMLKETNPEETKR